MNFTAKLQRLIASKGLTHAQLGEALGVSHVAVGNWLRGSLPHRSKAARIADFFGVTIDDLFDDSRALPIAARFSPDQLKVLQSVGEKIKAVVESPKMQRYEALATALERLEEQHEAIIRAMTEAKAALADLRVQIDEMGEEDVSEFTPKG